MRYFLLNTGGWLNLEKRYHTTKIPSDFISEKLRISTCNLEGVGVQNLITFYKTSQGLLLTPSRIMYSKRKNILIPWSEIIECRERKILWAKSIQMIIGNPFVSYIALREKDYEKIKDNIEGTRIRKNHS